RQAKTFSYLLLPAVALRSGVVDARVVPWTTKTVSGGEGPWGVRPALPPSAYRSPGSFPPGYLSMIKFAGLAAMVLWPRLRIVRPTVLTCSMAPRISGLVGPDAGTGVNRMLP